MSESAVIYVLDKLATRFFENEMQMIRGSGEGIVYLRGELERMRAFLRVADASEESDEEVKVWVKQIRDVAHEIEDLLDEFSLLVAQHNIDHGGGQYWFNGVFHKLSCCVKNFKARYRIASEIQAINGRLESIGKGYRRLHEKFRPLELTSGCNGVGNTWQDQRGDALLLDKTDLVGIDEPKKKLVKILANGSSGRDVVALTGMGGLGKTTLAKQVYDDAEVKKHFEIHAWTTVSKSFKVEDLLWDMVHQLFSVISKPVPKGIDNMSSAQLKTTIKKLLQKRRYLIVLDDVWRINEWDAVKYALPSNNCGSRVMITTRNADLAFTSLMESEGQVYNMEPLPPDDSWTLFCKKTFHGNPCPQFLEHICKSVLRKCEGLPLAIVAISGVLSTKDKRRIDQWEMVCRSLGAEIEVNDKLNFLKRVLSLSFNELPYYLQACFLYLSMFPEDHQIERLTLLRLWVAEGFVKAKEGKTLEEVAEDYFTELLKRSLIQAAVTTTDGRVKTCRIHDFLREIIIYKSREQDFVAIAKEHNGVWPDKIRRLSIHYSLKHVKNMNKSVSQMRSLLVFEVSETPCLRKLFPGDLKFLTVLELRGTPLTKFPIEIADLFHLRYLSLRDTKVESVPRYIGKLQNLETLDLKHTYVTELPIEVLKLKKLSHLLVYRYEIESYTHSKSGFKALRGIGNMRSLKKLCFLEVNQDSGDILADLRKLTQLRRLGVIKLRKEDGEILCSSIEMLVNLLALSIISLEEDEIIDLHHVICPPPLLQRLYLAGCLQRMPHWIPHLHSLVKVYLKWSRLKVDPLDSLQGLPNLVHLELLQVYEGDVLCFKAGGFKKLRHLGLDKFEELRWIKVEKGALTRLEKLSIQRCKSMEKVPLGIENLGRLKVLQFFDMPRDLIKSIRPDKEEGEDYWRVKHIPEVYIVYWRDGSWEVYSLESFSEGESSFYYNTSDGKFTLWKVLVK